MAGTVAIVLNWRDASSTITCIDSLLAIGGDLAVIVVDNDSGDGSLERIVAHCDAAAGSYGYAVISATAIGKQQADQRWMMVLSSGRNGGYAFGNNVGIRLALQVADCRYIWVLNADVVVPDASALNSLVATMESDPAIGICGAKVVYAGDPDTVQTLGGGTIDGQGQTHQLGQGQRSNLAVDEAAIAAKLDYINGACSFVSRRFVEDIGPMAEDYFLYFEEVDWFARARGRFRLGFCADAVVLHHVGKSIGTSDSDGRSALSTYYMTASRLRFCHRFMPRAVPHVMRDMVMEIARNLRHRRFRQALAIACVLLHTGPSIPRRMGIF